MSSPTSVPTASRILPACPSSGEREANGNSVEQGIRRYETPLNGIDGQAELLEDGDSEKDGIVVIPAYNEAITLVVRASGCAVAWSWVGITARGTRMSNSRSCQRPHIG